MASRNTVQRTIIAEELRRLANSSYCRRCIRCCFMQSIPSIGKATVYRTLGKLADEGEIGRVRINKRRRSL